MVVCLAAKMFGTWALSLDGMMIELKDQKKVGLMFGYSADKMVVLKVQKKVGLVVLMMDAQTYLEIHLAVMLSSLTKKDATMAGCLASLIMKGSWTVAYLAMKMGTTPNQPRRAKRASPPQPPTGAPPRRSLPATSR
jgi:hypothetical protein